MKDSFNESIVEKWKERIAEKWKEFYFSPLPTSFRGSVIDIIGDIKVQSSRNYILGTDGEGYYIVVEAGPVEWYDTLEGVQKFFLTELSYFGNEIIVIWEGDGDPPFIDGVTLEDG